VNSCLLGKKARMANSYAVSSVIGDGAYWGRDGPASARRSARRRILLRRCFLHDGSRTGARRGDARSWAPALGAVAAIESWAALGVEMTAMSVCGRSAMMEE